MSNYISTTNKEQAANFAVKVYYRLIRAGDTPKEKFISIYEVNYEALQKELDVLRFKSADETWFDFVIANRRSFYTSERSLSFLQYSGSMEAPNA